MTAYAGLNKTLASLKPLRDASPTDRKCYAIIHLLDGFVASRDFQLFSHRDDSGNVFEFEVFPASSESHAVKLRISTLLAEITEPIRRGLMDEIDLSILTQAGYRTSVRKVSLDEWEIKTYTRHGVLYTRFIDA